MRSGIRVSTASAASLPRRCGRRGRVCLTRDHDFGRLDDGQGLIASSKLQLVDGVAGDHGRERLITDAQTHLREQAFDADFVHVAAQLVPSAQRDNDADALGSGGRGLGECRRCEQPIDFRVRDAMVSSARHARSHAPLVDPVLERRVADAEPGRGLSDREQCHRVKAGSVQTIQLESY